MEIKKRVFLLAFLITLFLLVTIIVIGALLNTDRKEYVNDQMDVIANMNDIQTYSLLSDVYGDKLACIAFKKQLSQWDQTLWDLGLKLERYRVATEEFQKDQFYLEQKKKFNENELLYLAFLTKARKECDLNVNIITFFYKNSKECNKCDDQSFVLSDIKRELENEVSIFSFDQDLNLSDLQMLADYYEIDQYPCIIIDENKFCGMQDKDFIIEKMCDTNTNLSACGEG